MTTRPAGSRRSTDPAPAPPAWPPGTADDAGTPERGDRGGLIAALLVVVAVVAAAVVGGTYLWRRHHTPSVASPAACAVAAETVAGGRALTADPAAAAAWRAGRDAAHQHIEEGYLYVAAARYAGYAVRIATGGPDQPTAAERADVAAALAAHCRTELTVEFPAAP